MPIHTFLSEQADRVRQPLGSRRILGVPPPCSFPEIDFQHSKIQLLHPQKQTCPLKRSHFNGKIDHDFQGTCFFLVPR